MIAGKTSPALAGAREGRAFEPSDQQRPSSSSSAAADATSTRQAPGGPLLDNTDPRQRTRNGNAPSTLGDLIDAHLRGERAIAAARRFISRNMEARLQRSAVVGFLRRR